MAKLTAKQQAFVNEYVVDLNGAQAAIRAGYSEKTAKEIGAENLTKPNIANAIAEKMKSRNEKTEINAEYVLKRLVEIDEMDVADILNADMSLKSIFDWPKVWRRTISGIDITELASGDDVALLKKIKWPDKIKNLELLGKHTDIQAFKEKHQIEGDLTVNLIKELSFDAATSAKSPLPKDNVS